ncbi:serum amyloid P-component-like isoform X6 [Lathamus discolor]|uniref:serum amyloid P-component-like isoform X6 n=1 Tax=Lathamus discolor TaxID=678569 RepID=UPI0032B77272
MEGSGRFFWCRWLQVWAPSLRPWGQDWRTEMKPPRAQLQGCPVQAGDPGPHDGVKSLPLEWAWDWGDAIPLPPFQPINPVAPGATAAAGTMAPLRFWLSILAGLMGTGAQEDLYRKVFVFRNDPSDAYVVLRVKPEQPLLNFTVCLRSYTHLTRPHSLFSYATKAQDNEILLFKPKPGEYRFYVGGKFVTFRVPESRGDWEHVCAGWESGTGVAEFWLDGKPWPRKGLQRGYAVGPEAAVLLGQEQDAFGGGFDVYNSFSGELADVYLWDTVLSPDRMRAAFQSLRLPPALLAWSSLSYSIKGDVVVKPRLRAALGA